MSFVDQAHIAFGTREAVILWSAVLIAFSIPAKAGNEQGRLADPSLFIDSVLPHPYTGPDVNFTEELPLVPESEAAAMWNWSGESPIGVQAVFETFNRSLGRLDYVDVFVNGQPMPDVQMIALGNGTAGLETTVADGQVDVAGRGVVNRANTYKISFLVPYRIPDELLKVHLEIEIRAGFEDGTTVGALKRVTLLNNARLTAILEEIDVRLVVLEGRFDFLCTALNGTISGINVAGNGINTALQALRFSDIVVDIPEVDLGDPCPGAIDCPIEFDIPSFTIPNPLKNAYGDDVVPDIGSVDCSF